MKTLVHFFNHSNRESDSYMPNHKHPMFEIVYYCKGYGHTTINGVISPYSPGQFAIIYPEVVHDEYRKTATEVIYFGFITPYESIQLAQGLHTDTEYGTLRKLLQEMMLETAQKRNHYTIKLDLLLQSALIEISRMHEKLPVQPSSDHEERLTPVIQFIEQYYADSLNIKQLAHIAGYSYDHFRHIFKEYTGATPMNYWIHLRIQKSKELLLEHQKKMTQIAFECGFSSLSHFSNTFRTLTGHSPREFVKQNRA
ncbi:helix-turn-helix transcriptional regulator [Paenibacillus agricola]|uniref:AraC family transcriptional regulator n=1 Tax=Paenibacillus agricola TaxID=2716264 RepID=A0ABX0J3I6_9BACL|nr:AraC family transcriptional regulator [Paenibacillus agricola]NHN30854.1 AraC family transcriptional regulator [Paenibacillus agricola]